MADNFYSKYPNSGGSGGVSSLNGLTGALTLVSGSGITITPSGSDITITATGGGGGADTDLGNLTSPTAINQTLTSAVGTSLALLGPDSSTVNPPITTVTGGNFTGAPGIRRGGGVNITGGGGASRGGGVSISGGSADTQGGSVGIMGGNSLAGPATGGNVSISDGLSIGAAGTGIQITTATQDADFDSGTILIRTGDAAPGVGATGDIVLTIGAIDTGTLGDFQFTKSGTTNVVGDVWTATSTDGKGYWAAGGGGGATIALDNLTSVAINTDLIFGANVAGILKTSDSMSATTQDLTLSTGDGTGHRSGNLTLKSGNSDTRAASANLIGGICGGAFPGGAVFVQGGANSGTGTGGTATIQGGSSVADAGGNVLITPGVGTSRGVIQLQDGSEGIPAYVWTSTDVSGTGTWSPGGADANLSNLTAPTSINADLISSQDSRIFSTFPSTGDSTVLDGTTTMLAEPFSPLVDTTVRTAIIGIKFETLSLAGNLFVNIYDDASGVPGTSLGTSDALVASTLNAGADSAEFTFTTPVALTGVTSYWIVVYGDSTYNSGSDHVTVESAVGANGQQFTGSWSALGTAIAARVGTGAPNNLGDSGDPWNILYSNDISSKVNTETSLGTLTWAAGIAPSGTIVKSYRAYQLGGQVTVTAKITATGAGTAVTAVSFPLPAGLPAPVTWGTQESGGLVVPGTGSIQAAVTSSVNGNSGLYSDGSGGWVIKITDLSAVAATAAYAQVTYYSV